MYSDNEYEYSDGGSDDDEENKSQQHAHDTSFSSALSEMSGVGKSPGGPTAANSSRDSHSSNIADGGVSFYGRGGNNSSVHVIVVRGDFSDGIGYATSGDSFTIYEVGQGEFNKRFL